jgi:hypothetical protein
MTRDLFMRVLTNFPTNVGEQAEVANLRRLNWAHITRKPTTGILALIARNAPAPPYNKELDIPLPRDTLSRLGGGQSLSIPTTARPHARKYQDNSALHKHKAVFAPKVATTRVPGLPLLNIIEEWAQLVHTHTHVDFATLANNYTNDYI